MLAGSLLVCSVMKKTPTYPRRAQDAYITQGMLYKVRDELKADIESARFELKSDIHDLKADMHRIGLLVEEQNNRNKIVLDGLAHIIYRQDRIEAEWIEFKK